MRQLIDQQSRTAQERAELQAALDKEAEDRKIIEVQKTKLASKLKVQSRIVTSLPWRSEIDGLI